MDVYRVRLSRKARGQLDDTFAYVCKESPDSAARLVDEILGAIHRLRRMPGRTVQVARARRTGLPVHASIVSPYIVYYVVDDPAREVLVVEIRHGAQRPP